MPNKVSKELHHKRLSRSISAFAGLTGALSAAIGVAAASMSPSGFSALLVDLGVDDEPIIVELAPYTASVAAGLGILAGIVGFYSWLRDRKEEREEGVLLSRQSDETIEK